MATTEDPSPLARALGRIPTGLYVVSTKSPDGPVGFVGSLLVQVGLAPPVVCVAVGRERAALEALRASGGFAASIRDDGSKDAMGAFFRSYEAPATPFDQVPHVAAPSGAPVLSAALAWIDCEITGEHELDDHVIVFGAVTEGALQHEGDPAVHLRKSGLSY